MSALLRPTEIVSRSLQSGSIRSPEVARGSGGGVSAETARHRPAAVAAKPAFSRERRFTNGDVGRIMVRSSWFHGIRRKSLAGREFAAIVTDAGAAEQPRRLGPRARGRWSSRRRRPETTGEEGEGKWGKGEVECRGTKKAITDA